MNIKSKNVRRRIAKYYEDVARWGTPEAKARFINIGAARAKARNDARIAHELSLKTTKE